MNGEDRYAFLELLQYFIGEQTFKTMLLLTGQDINENDSSSTSRFVTGSYITHFKIENVLYITCMILNGFLLKPVRKEY